MSAPRLPSGNELLVLRLLRDGGAQYGLELVEASGGKLGRAGIYVTLSRMEEKGFVKRTVRKHPEPHPGIPRPRYSVTALGERSYRAACAALSELQAEWVSP
jgi:DNA-binding PadR family transcriptional regulator